MTQVPTVTIIGAGALGAAMAARLGETGHQVRLWNRTAEQARAAAEGVEGVTAVDDLSDAVAGSPVVLTVLRDGDAVGQVMADEIDRLEADAHDLRTVVGQLMEGSRARKETAPSAASPKSAAPRVFTA